MKKIILLLLISCSFIIGQDRQQLGKNTIAEIYIASNQVLSMPAANTYYQVVGFSSGVLQNASVSSSRVTIKQSGYYKITYSASFTHANNNTIIHISLFVDGVENTKMEIERKIGSGGDLGAASASSIVYLNANQIIDMRARTETNTGNLTTTHANFSAILIR